MAIGTPDTNESLASQGKQERYIERQLRRTGARVKLNDIVAGVLVVTVASMALLLSASLVDHWIVELGFWGRLFALFVLLVGVTWYIVDRFAPLVWNRINPVYAAHVIEDGTPSLKNSLVNFLMLRSKRSAVRQVIYTAVQNRAAEDLTDVDLESIVDRTKLIRIGYALTAIVIACSVYKVFSPKDPFQTVQRVLLPWADIERPARVQIHDVRVNEQLVELWEGENGDIYQGQSVAVSAVVGGLSRDDQVNLFYSTQDGQAVDQVVRLQLPEREARFHGVLPKGGKGIQQDVVFRIEAGDAGTRDYRLTVSAAPYIAVESVEYVFPEYTGREPLVVERNGDLVGLDGTRVTIRAVANQDIKSAALHFDADRPEGQQIRARYLPMTVKDRDANTSFNLTWLSDQRLPEHRSYQIRFRNSQGQNNPDPVEYLIEVTPDLPPEVEILAPSELQIEVPEDGSRTIEVRAMDPDFALTAVRLWLQIDQQEAVTPPDTSSLNEPTGRVGAVQWKYIFDPRKLNLQAGQKVTYWAEAADNRADSTSGAPRPNITVTPRYQINIIAANRLAATNQSQSEPDHARDDEANGSEQESSEQPGGDGESQSEGKSESGGDSGGEDVATEGGGESQQGDQDTAPRQDAASQEGDSSQDRNDSQVDDTSNGDEKSPHGDGTTAESSESESSGDAQRRSEQRDGSANQPGDGPGQAYENNGSEDADVFDEVIEHIRDKGSSDEQRAQSDEGEKSDPISGRRPAGAKPQSGDGIDEPAESPLDAEKDSDPPKPGQNKPHPGSDADSDRQNPGSGSPQPRRSVSEKDSNKGQAASPRSDLDREPGDEANSRDSGIDDEGSDGNGRPNSDEERSPPPQGTNRTSENQPQSGAPNDRPEETAISPSTSKRQSDSKGDQDGDKSGEGSEGGGQPARQPGKESPGSSSAADEGRGAAAEAGDGEDSTEAGRDRQAESRTGESGQQSGSGTDSENSASRQQSGKGQQGHEGEGSNERQSPTGDQSDLSNQEDQKGDESTLSSAGGQSTGGSPTAGGRPGEQSATADGGGDSFAASDDPNIEYARKATDLVLDYLEDQRDNPDRQLLDKLGWTEEDVEKFLQRWQQLNQNSARDSEQGGQAKGDLERALRSLGLHPRSDTFRREGDRSDAFRGLREGGRSGRAPTKYLDQVRAFQRSRTVEQTEGK